MKTAKAAFVLFAMPIKMNSESLLRQKGLRETPYPKHSHILKNPAQGAFPSGSRLKAANTCQTETHHLRLGIGHLKGPS